MKDYDKKILNALLDSYENSVLSRGENKVTVRIAFRFTRRSMPEYFDESSTEYEEIHACIDHLLEKGFLAGIEWKNGLPGHIVQKVYLNEERADEVYAYLDRTPKRRYELQHEELLMQLLGECTSPAAAAFIAWLRERITQHLPVGEFIDLSDPEGTRQLIRCVWYVETNASPCYEREFSILHFSDSKLFERIRGTVRRILIRFGGEPESADEKEIFAEYGIYDTPDYVYLKGEGVLHMAGNVIMLETMRQGIGISGEDLETVQIRATDRTRRVMTIENLTTFFRMRENDALLIYLGGYHNRTRRRLLTMIHEQLPEAQYLHFGDIDAGGFAIYEDLCRRTGIPFQIYRMGTAELEHYRPYAKALTANDRRRLQHMLEEPPAHLDAYREAVEYMLEQGIKLEQECIL